MNTNLTPELKAKFEEILEPFVAPEYLEGVALELLQAHELERWVDVKEKLPEDGVRVLLLSHSHDVAVGHHVTRGWKTDIIYSEYRVKAWQPLPNPPTK